MYHSVHVGIGRLGVHSWSKRDFTNSSDDDVGGIVHDTRYIYIHVPLACSVLQASATAVSVLEHCVLWRSILPLCLLFPRMYIFRLVRLLAATTLLDKCSNRSVESTGVMLA